MSSAPMLSWLLGRNTLAPWLRSVTAASLVCACATISVPAWAGDDVAAAQQLMTQGKTADAAKLVQKALKQQPADLQLRFLQGVIAAEQQKYDQAIKIFTALTQDHPQLPEPYNNLAVLHAAKGEERKAAQVLEQAIRTNPSYATAHENLGDLYARMASDAYAKALQLDSSRQANRIQLSLIKQLQPVALVTASTIPAVGTTTATASKPATPAPVAAPAPAKPAEPKKVEAAAAEPAPATAAPVPTAKPEEPARSPAASTTVADKKAAPKAPAPAHDDQAQQHALIESAVHAWAKAWASQDINGYFAAYSDRFDPQGGTLSAWKQGRKDRIVGKAAITVDIHDLKINIQGDRATASFRQYYESGAYKATTRKTLRMQREASKWRIVREETGR